MKLQRPPHNRGSKIVNEAIKFGDSVRLQIEEADVIANHTAAVEKDASLGVCPSMGDPSWRTRHNNLKKVTTKKPAGRVSGN